MSLNAGKILGINITLDFKETILEKVEKYLLQSPNPNTQSLTKTIKPLVIVTPNPEQIVLAQQNVQFREILNQADVAIPDGIGIILAGRFLNGKWQMANDKSTVDRIAGVDFMEDLVGIAAKRGVRIGLIGGGAGLADKALECLQKNYHGLEGWAEEGPEIEIKSTKLSREAGSGFARQIYKSTNNSQKIIDTEQYIQELAHKIEKTKSQIVFVGLGAPKQEYVIEALSHQLSASLPRIFMSVGGSFDIMAGKIQRAPVFIRSIGFEWAWRLFQEPWRWRRQLALLTFVRLVIKEKLASQSAGWRTPLRS